MPSTDVLVISAPEGTQSSDKDFQKDKQLDIAIADSSLRTPVTPAALNEASGSPALRWKSYTANKQRETECGSGNCNGNASSNGNANLGTSPVSAVDAKGKLVINLSGIPRSVMKASSTMKSEALQENDARHSEANTSLNGVQKEKLNSSEELPKVSMSLNAVKNSNGFVLANNLARKISLRIKKVRNSVAIAPAGKRNDHTIKKKHENVTSTRIATTSCGSPVVKNDSNEALDGVEEMTLVAMNSDEMEHIVDNSGSTKGTNASDLTGDHSAGGNESREHDTGAITTKNNQSISENLAEETDNDARDAELTSKEHTAAATSRIKQHVRSSSNDVTACSDASKLDMKEQTVLETLLRDEPAGYSSGGGSEPSRSCRVEKSRRSVISQGERSEGDDADSEKGDDVDSENGCHSDEYEEEEEEEEAEDDDDDDDYTDCSHSHGCDDECCECNAQSPCSAQSPSTSGTSGRGAHYSEQVPSVLCDAEGNMWHIGKRAEQARGIKTTNKMSPQRREPLNEVPKPGYAVETHSPISKQTSGSSVVPFNHLIETNWKWPSDADYSFNPVTDVSSRSMVSREKSVFVGCIPDGTENLDEILRNLMDRFLERFDFAPSILGQLQAVKIGKDFAFLELATEKVVHIALAANQLDVFEWGVNGFHFNIEGCKGTHSSVRPLIEYMPLKPARVIFVGNIPKSRWQKEYLEVFFSRLLRGSDAPTDMKYVSSVFLLPESCDAYVELASEMMADSIIFKCTKNAKLLKDIGEDVFICRDRSSVPLMSKHKGVVSPQRAVFVGVSAPGQEFKIECVRKIFEEIVPYISRMTNQPGYLEYISYQPGKDYAFFQFNSEAIVDVLMDEYVENTQLFMSKEFLVSYIILRPPEYVRPGARFHGDGHYSRGLSLQPNLVSRKRSKSNIAKLNGGKPALSRRFGDEPAKKADCVMSMGVSSPPLALWNGLPFTGACAADPECMLLIEGLPKGLGYKLLRGALNELFERLLCRTGLLKVGMLVLRYLDRDGDLNVVASLPNPRFVEVLLSSRKKLAVAQNEILLTPKSTRRMFPWRGNPTEHVRAQGDVSCLSDDEADQPRYGRLQVMVSNKRKRPQIGTISRPQARRGHANGIVRGPDMDRAIQYEHDAAMKLSPQPKILRQNGKDISQQRSGLMGINKVASRQLTGSPMAKVTWQGNNPISRARQSANNSSKLKSDSRSVLKVNRNRPKSSGTFQNETLHIVSEGGKRKIQAVGKCNTGLQRQIVIANKKRKPLQFGANSSVQKSMLTWRRVKK